MYRKRPVSTLEDATKIIFVAGMLIALLLVWGTYTVLSTWVLQ